MNLTWHIVFVGIVFFQLLFMLLQWLIYKRAEYAYYATYILFIGLYIVFRVDAASQIFDFNVPYFVQEVLNQPTAIFSYLTYLYFTRQFLNLKTTQPKVYQISLILEKLFIIFITFKIISLSFSISYSTTVYIYVVFSFLSFIVVLPMVILMLQKKDTLTNFVVMGSLLYMLGGLTGVAIGALSPGLGKNNLNVLYGLEIGVLCEVLLINIGFILKNKILQHQVLKGQQKIIDNFLQEQKNINH